MQSTTLLCPTSPSCLPFAPALTNLFSLSPNPHSSPFILSPSITYFPSFKSSSAILSPLSFFFLSLLVSLIHLQLQHLPLLSHFSAIFISISLAVRGRGGRVSFRGDSFRETCQCACSHRHAHTQLSPAIYCLPSKVLFGGQLLN